MSSAVDPTGAATSISAEAEMALALRDTRRAQEKFAEAGAILERNISGVFKGADKQLLRFLAATQYYRGGHYSRAIELAKKIQARVLPKYARVLLPQFLHDVNARLAPGYTTSLYQRLYRHWRAKRHNDVLAVLQDHPYLLPPGDMALLRATECQQLGDIRAADLFYAAAIRFVPVSIDWVFRTSAYPLRLAIEGKLEVAWEYAHHQVQLFRHPITFITASLVMGHQALNRKVEERQTRLDHQLALLQQAWDTYQKLPEVERNHRYMRPYMASGFELGAAAWLLLENRVRAREACDHAIQLCPGSAGPWTMRGLTAYPDSQAASDFRKAITFPDADFVPYELLALQAWESGDAQQGLSFCEEALLRNPSGHELGTIYGLMAMCKQRMGASRSEVDSLFQKALQVAPNHAKVIRNYQLFLEAGDSVPRQSTWEVTRPSLEELLAERRAPYLTTFAGEDSMLHDPQPVGA